MNMSRNKRGGKKQIIGENVSLWINCKTTCGSCGFCFIARGAIERLVCSLLAGPLHYMTLIPKRIED
jgi:hypothetical protein